MNESFLRLAAPLMDAGAVVFGEDMEWIAKYGHKGILHRHMRSLETPSVIEQIDPAIRVPRGYTCSSVEHLLEAYRLLDTRNVVVRPIHSSGGEGTLFLNEAEQLRMYDFPAGDVNLEEALELDKAPDGIILSPTLQYSEGSILGTAPFDQVMVAQACMGWRHSVASTAFHKSARRYAQSIMAAVTPRAAGGFDFVSVNGLPVLADVALGQLGEAHVPFLFQEAHAPGLAFFCWRFRPSERLTVQTFWKRLRSSGCGLNPGKSREGIFPASYLRGAAGMFVAVARDELSCLALHEKAKNMLSANAPAPIPLEGPTAVEQRFKLTLIKNAEAIYLPEYVAARHILLGGTQVVGLLDDEAAARLEGISADIAAMVIDATGCVVVPGFVDIHVHITGGGGELGPASRTPEARVNQIIDGGMTTVVGVLGTDCVSRSLENLLVKARALTAEGLTAFMWTGAYRNPPPTLTGSVRRDLVIVEQCIGVGEMAISDHRGSQPDVRLISELAAECRVGGMLAGKAGLLYCHVGTGPGMLEPLRQCVRETEIPITTFLPTHMERNEALIADGAQWLRDGGYIDLTCRSIKALMALKKFDQEGLPLAHVCVSSDSFGSLPTYDELGRLVRYRAADAKAMLQFLWKMYFQELWPLEKILPLITSNPARILKLPGKGSISVGSDGDVLLLDKNTLQLKYVIAKGQVVKTPKWTHTGMLGTGGPAGGAASGSSQHKPEPRQARRKGARAAGRGDGGGGGGAVGDRGGGGGDTRDGDGSEEVNRGPARYLIGARESRPDSDGAPRAQGGPGHRGMFKWIPGCC